VIIVGEVADMRRHSVRILTAILTFVVGISVVGGWFYYRETQKVNIEVPNARWEKIFFKLIDRTTELGGLKPLRETKVSDGHVEVRIWRGFGLADLEGVILKRVDGEWNALHVKADDYYEPTHVEALVLKRPQSNFEALWLNITEHGLLTLRDPSEKNCEDLGLDGSGYVVEINQNRKYRTYHFREEGECDGVSQIETIDDIIGEEFDTGQEECKTAEWFACAKYRKSYRQNRTR
jgi:hypothetical protein